MPDTTASHHVLFGKNSDRQRNESQTVEYFPRAQHPPDATLKCTYISIPQAPLSHSVLLCRPFWIWGAEMGANEHGVVIGNEGLHAREPASQVPALTGMDLLRLALERACTAAEAVQVIATLLEQYGQGGNCGHLTPNYYNNGFMIADPSEAFVLETIGKEWRHERVMGVHAISNTYSVGADVAAIADPEREHIGQACVRRARATALLDARKGQLRAADLMRILRDHGGSDPASPWDPQRSPHYTLCMHAGVESRPGQTTGSLVSEIRSADSVHWVTGTAAPCLSVFKPVLLDVPLPFHGPRPTDRFDAHALWWRHETLHRTVLLRDLSQFPEEMTQERDALEACFHTRVHSVLDTSDPAARTEVIIQCWQEAAALEARWLSHLKHALPPQGEPYQVAWSTMSRLAGMPE
jgi:secernin